MSVSAKRCVELLDREAPLSGEVCNDKHSHLNPTSVLGRIVPRSVDEVASAVQRLRLRGDSMSIAGSCHAMGGQQFAQDAWLLDMRSMNRVLGFDRERGIIHAQAGITWP